MKGVSENGVYPSLMICLLADSLVYHNGFHGFNWESRMAQKVITLNLKRFRTNKQLKKKTHNSPPKSPPKAEKAPKVKDILAMLFSSAMIASSVESLLAFHSTGWGNTSGSSSTKLCKRWFWKRPGPQFYGIGPTPDHVSFFTGPTFRWGVLKENGISMKLLKVMSQTHPKTWIV